MPCATRRDFLAGFGAAAVSLAFAGPLGAAGRCGQRGLEQFLSPAPPCKDDLTPASPPSIAFRTDAPIRPSLVEPGTTGTRIRLTGFVTGLTCGRIKDARLDFWHAGPDGKIDSAGFKFRGAVLTGADGRYSMETLAPGNAAGATRRIWVRVTPPATVSKAPGKRIAPLTTALYFPDDVVAAREKDFKTALVMKRAAGADNSYTFDFLLDA